MTHKKKTARREEVEKKNNTLRLNYKALYSILFICAIILRVTLSFLNPPFNAFDNHFEPIVMIAESGVIPAKDACFQCYHPPAFYWSSAMVGNFAHAIGFKTNKILKIIQFLSCFYGILTLAVLFLILRKLPLSEFSRLLAFGIACFLPRHIFMSAMNSNDSMSYLFVALSIYFLILALEKKLPEWLVLGLSVVLTITFFTKYTAFVVLPIIFVVFALMYYKQMIPRKKVVLSFCLVLFLPMSLLSYSVYFNIKTYGSPLPWNVKMVDPSLIQPRDQTTFDFFTFKPWDSLSTPSLVPGKMHSYWTIIYSGMWVDNDPKFIFYLDSNHSWWEQYYAWLYGKSKSFPGENPSTTMLTKLTNASLVTLGLIPMALMFIGLYTWLIGIRQTRLENMNLDSIKISIFPILLLFNAVGMILIAIRLPVHSAAKASYFLNSLSAFAVFFSLGIMRYEKNEKFKQAIVTVTCLICFIVSVHVLLISHGIYSITKM